MLHGYGLYAEEHEAFRSTVRSVVQKELRPHAAEWEQQEEFPRALFRRFGELGFLGLKYPEAYGGSATEGQSGELFEAVLLEELGRCGSGGVAAGLGAQFTIATGPLHKFGTDAQKRRFLAPAIRGERIGALGVTEPDAGSDVASLRTTARRDGSHYVVNGAKLYITNGVRADFVVLAVKTDPAAGRRGLSLLVVERGTPGFSVGRKLQKLGWRSSDTAELVFEDCRVPAENLLGQEGEGFAQIMGNFQWERLSLALGALGAMDDMLDTVLEHVRQRRAFGQPLAGFQVVRHRLAELATARECARQLTYHALRLHVGGEYAIAQTSMAKKVATETACQVADACLQLHGGAGYMMEYDIQRHWRDARLGPIGGGTSEVMNEIIAKQLGL
ncbi:acyl-CoA dehydrogenase [Aggregicoccus sp. 17bor-14]|uniref:acyl-CoA dehydrogenase family protein n=1 Tax=Myxococcaceae TaxID=31 RepID=UPI00129C848C|nr:MULTISPECIES: acyl-CoA dehydrogenase family protein [Myxococcaceae]MBF5041197.1 acyl-CoA dehydrogenase family protein [Simulacricoccus sp. 17bor-14]MRI86984.1 acyl-CoA dehydrogenase [Aggregicoccus sp. 17bor-14]